MAADDTVECALPVSVWTSSKKHKVACRRQRGAGGVHILLLKSLGAAVVLRNSCIPVHHGGKKREGALGPCMPLDPGLAGPNQRPLSIRTFFTPHSDSIRTADKVHVCSRQPTEWPAAVSRAWLHARLRWRNALFAVYFKEGERGVLTFGGKPLTTTTCGDEFAEDTVGLCSCCCREHTDTLGS